MALHSDVAQKQIEEWMVSPGILSRDLGTIFVGEEAVKAGLYQEVGGICEALTKLHQKIDSLSSKEVKPDK